MARPWIARSGRTWLLVCGASLGASGIGVAQTTLDGVVRMAAGGLHTCAVLTSGIVACWGYNGYGQIGDGGPVDHWLPAPAAIEGVATDVSAGGRHTCAIVDAALDCWGWNNSGQLGDGSTTTRHTPVRVSGLDADVTAVIAGSSHTCAVVAGAAKCWGQNAFGQLGIGMEGDDVTSPVQVQGLTAGVTGVAAASIDSCAIVNGGAKCWGGNGAGMLGDGTYSDSSVPVDVQGLQSGVTRIAAAGNTVCAIVNEAVKCWGYGFDGELGNGSFYMNSNTPVDVVGLDAPAIELALGSGFACALLSDQTLHCWGDGSLGELGTGGYPRTAVPVTVDLPGPGLAALAAGAGQMCAARAGTAYCWGWNILGQLGFAPGLASPFEPAVLRGLPGPAQAIAKGAQNACAIANGSLSCWGSNNFGQLGDGTVVPRGAPVQVAGLDHDVTAVALDYDHTCAIVGGGAYCWGDNSDGQLGDASTDPHVVPMPVSELAEDVSALAVGLDHSCAIASGAVKCWGNFAMLGSNAGANASVPVDVTGLSAGATALTAGQQHTCAVVSGAAKCWGANSGGELGGGPSSPPGYAMEPIDVVGLQAGVTAVASGGRTTCAIVNAGVVCWGIGDFGQLGDGQLHNSDVPVPVIGLDSGVLAITVGSMHTCALTTTAVMCWGDNSFGALGNGGGNGGTPTPVAASLLPPGVSAIAANHYSTCAISDGDVLCWGYNEAGELGIGGLAWLPSPHAVTAGDPIFANGFDG